MQNTLLISLDDVLSYTTLSANMDESKINSHIFNAQILYLESILGSDLYDKIISLTDSNYINSSGYTNYKTLLDVYITPSLVFHAVELFLGVNAFQITDGGIFRHQPTNATTSPLEDIDKVSQKYRIIGQKYDKKLADYLCKNSSLFIEYVTNDGLVKKTEVTQRSGFYLGTSHIHSKIRK